MSIFVTGILLLSIVKSPAVSSPDPAGPAMGVVDAWQAVVRRSAILIDVREESEIAEGMAAPALWIATSAIESDEARWRAFLASLPPGKTLIFYCTRGGRAYRAAASAAALGYTTARMAPFSDWVRAGLPVRVPPRHS